MFWILPPFNAPIAIKGYSLSLIIIQCFHLEDVSASIDIMLIARGTVNPVKTPSADYAQMMNPLAMNALMKLQKMPTKFVNVLQVSTKTMENVFNASELVPHVHQKLIAINVLKT